MAKSFNELRGKMAPERRRRNAAEANRMLLEMTLQELRQGLTNFSQDDIAEMLHVTQGYVSKLERQNDMLLSNLYAYVEALGGEARFGRSFPAKRYRSSSSAKSKSSRPRWRQRRRARRPLDQRRGNGSRTLACG